MPCPEPIETTQPYNLSLSFTEWDLPNEVFDAVAGAGAAGDRLSGAAIR